MRDAFGGVFMIRLFLVFIVIYVAFTAISLNYAKAFRIKNSIISFIEEKQITDLDAFFSKGNDKDRKELANILLSANYEKTCNNGNGKIDTGPGTPPIYCYNGIIIEQKEKTKNKIIYNVYTYAGWNLGILNTILALGGEDPTTKEGISGSWQITGEAIVRLRSNADIDGSSDKGLCYCVHCDSYGGTLTERAPNKTKATCSGSCQVIGAGTGNYMWNPSPNYCTE